MHPRLIRNILLTVGLLALCGGGVWAFVNLWSSIGGGPMTGHGWVALMLGLVGTLILAVVLMVLAFRSDRDGWDDRADTRADVRAPGARQDQTDE